MLRVQICAKETTVATEECSTLGSSVDMSEMQPLEQVALELWVHCAQAPCMEQALKQLQLNSAKLDGPFKHFELFHGIEKRRLLSPQYRKWQWEGM